MLHFPGPPRSSGGTLNLSLALFPSPPFSFPFSQLRPCICQAAASDKGADARTEAQKHDQGVSEQEGALLCPSHSWVHPAKPTSPGSFLPLQSLNATVDKEPGPPGHVLIELF